ncbi:OPT oligopeptide transporter [Colletotrichum orchidophilum]|uniref:OPT oligopeptide transporter n=1 Tax=Colletotrichum orchidophilum TaxID=1209926 RepID=A0A1G4AU19_9PEZI|nr:OPT oligopeptide transporter [Colletotrichum orchidophilum]OHE92552.1 OPT oligopeptide transporter [Colletotrichum orchidophilum]
MAVSDDPDSAPSPRYRMLCPGVMVLVSLPLVEFSLRVGILVDAAKFAFRSGARSTSDLLETIDANKNDRLYTELLKLSRQVQDQSQGFQSDKEISLQLAFHAIEVERFSFIDDTSYR